MATVIGADLPAVLMQRLGQSLASSATAVPVCTIDPDGHAHPAMLSYAELTASDSRSIHASIYGSSGTARNLRERGRMTLLFVDDEITCYVKASTSALDMPHPSRPGVAVFPLVVDAVLVDQVDTSREPATVITTGIRFRRVASRATP